MKISGHTERLTKELWKRALREAYFYPVDRYFLEQYLEQIRAVNTTEFISHTLTLYPSTYATQLLYCLPELWEELTLKDILEIIGSLPHAIAFFNFILFTYRHVQVDMLSLILQHPTVDEPMKQELRDFLKTQFYHLIQQDGDIEDFEEDEVGIPSADWIYVRQKLLTYDGIKPAKQSLAELKAEVDRL